MKLKLKPKLKGKAAQTNTAPLPTKKVIDLTPSGRKPKNYDFVVTDEVLARMSTLSASGLNLEQIAHCFDISYETLHRHAKADERIDRAIKGGRAKAVAMVANRLYNDALKEDNLGAQAFYLKQNGFRDNASMEITGAGGGPLEVAEVRYTAKERAARIAQILNAAKERKATK